MPRQPAVDQVEEVPTEDQQRRVVGQRGQQVGRGRGLDHRAHDGRRRDRDVGEDLVDQRAGRRPAPRRGQRPLPRRSGRPRRSSVTRRRPPPRAGVSCFPHPHLVPPLGRVSAAVRSYDRGMPSSVGPRRRAAQSRTARTEDLRPCAAGTGGGRRYRLIYGRSWAESPGAAQAASRTCGRGRGARDDEHGPVGTRSVHPACSSWTTTSSSDEGWSTFSVPPRT